jgi:gamma-carbonic anhydrase
MVHCTSEYSTSIGNRAIVGSGAICHGCVLEDESVVGTGAQIMDGAVVQKHAMVAAGALVSRGKIVPTGQLWSGIPAVFERELTAEEISNIVLVAEENTELAVQHQLESDKTWQMIEQEEFEHEQVLDRNPDYYKRLTEEVYSPKMLPFTTNLAHRYEILMINFSLKLSIPSNLIAFPFPACILC